MPSAGWNDSDESKRKRRHWSGMGDSHDKWPVEHRNDKRRRWAWTESDMVKADGGWSGTRYTPASMNSEIHTPEDTSADAECSDNKVHMNQCTDDEVHTPDDDEDVDQRGTGQYSRCKAWWSRFKGIKFNGQRIREEIKNHSYH